jgi:uncharacterized phage-associated protein
MLVQFDQKAAIEAVLYLTHHSCAPTFHHIFKLLYFADLAHLEKYGRLIYGDQYIAMKDGPVPSAVYDMLKSVRDSSIYLNFPDASEALGVVEGYRISALREPNLEWLSDSDIECLNSALDQYDHMSYRQLTDLSHDTAWESADRNGEISLESIVVRLGNPSGLLEHLQDPNP